MGETVEAVNRKKIDDLDFEISFYEALIKDRPDFIDALVLLGDVYTKRGYYQKGLNIDKRLVRLKPDDPIVYYNLACSYSLVGDIDASLTALRNAVKRGYGDLNFINKDADLENARKDRRFKRLMAGWRKERGGGVHGIWFIKDEDIEKSKKVKRERSSKKKNYQEGKATKEKRHKKEKRTRRSCTKG